MELLHQNSGQYDAVIMATFPQGFGVPAAGCIERAGRWLTPSGAGQREGGEAALMNTPSFNSRATAQMVPKPC
jgi:hypothetical protein